MKRFDEIKEYMRVKHGRTLIIGNNIGTKEKFLHIHVNILDGDNIRTVSGSVSMSMRVSAKLEDVIHVAAYINDIETSIKMHKAICKRCIEVGGGCERIKSNELAYLDCEEI